MLQWGRSVLLAFAAASVVLIIVLASQFGYTPRFNMEFFSSAREAQARSLSKPAQTLTNASLLERNATDLPLRNFSLTCSGSSPNVTSIKDFDNDWGGVTLVIDEGVIRILGVYTTPDSSFPELLVWVRVNMELETTRVLLPSRPAIISLPTSFRGSDVEIHVKIISILFNNCSNVIDAATWNSEQHPSGSCGGLETTIAEKLIRVSPCTLPTSAEYSVKLAPLQPRVVPVVEKCGFISGKEDAQWWTPNLFWEPQYGSCEIDRDVPKNILKPSISFAVAFMGDSQIRTSFEAAMGRACPQWDIFDYGGKNKLGCHQVPFDASKSRLINGDVCRGAIRTIGEDGCWSGGAVWQSHHLNHTLTYIDSHSGNDVRYLDQNWLSKHWSATKLRGNHSLYDIVVVGSDLHGTNKNVDDYIKGLRTRFENIRRWHIGPILCVGQWGVSNERRGKNFEWAGSKAKANAMAYAAEEMIANYQKVWYISFLNPTMNARKFTRDGVHLLWEHPMGQIADVLWHNIGYLVKKGK